MFMIELTSTNRLKDIFDILIPIPITYVLEIHMAILEKHLA